MRLSESVCRGAFELFNRAMDTVAELRGWLSPAQRAIRRRAALKREAFLERWNRACDRNQRLLRSCTHSPIIFHRVERNHRRLMQVIKNETRRLQRERR